MLAKNAYSAKMIGGAAGDETEANSGGRVGMFLALSGGDGDKETTATSRGFDYQSRSATIGLDYVLSPSLILGVALGYSDTESALFQNSGQLDIESNSVSIYLSKFLSGGWFIDGAVGLGKVTTDSRRNIDFTVGQEAISQVARADFDSDQNLLSLGVGKRIDGYIDIDLSARVNYIDTNVERFAEATNRGRAGFGLAIEIDEQDITSLTSDINIRFSRTYSTNWGVLIPGISFRWQHEFDRGESALLGRFLSDPNDFDFQKANIGLNEFDATLFEVPLELIDTDYGAAKLGVVALFPSNFSLSVSASQTIGLSNFDHTYFSLVLRKDF